MIRLMTLGELLALLDSLTFAELRSLAALTDETRTDAEYLAAASQWYAQTRDRQTERRQRVQSAAN